MTRAKSCLIILCYCLPLLLLACTSPGRYARLEDWIGQLQLSDDLSGKGEQPNVASAVAVSNTLALTATAGLYPTVSASNPAVISASTMQIVEAQHANLDVLLGFDLALPPSATVTISGGGAIASVQYPFSVAEATELIKSQFVENGFSLINETLGAGKEQVYIFQQSQKWVSITILQKKDSPATINFAFTD